MCVNAYISASFTVKFTLERPSEVSFLILLHEAARNHRKLYCLIVLQGLCGI